MPVQKWPHDQHHDEHNSESLFSFSSKKDIVELSFFIFNSKISLKKPCWEIIRGLAPPPNSDSPVCGGEEDQALGKGELNVSRFSGEEKLP